MKLKNIGFRKKPLKKPTPNPTPLPNESTSLVSENLPEKQPGWLTSYHEADRLIDQMFKENVEKMYKVV